MSERKTVSVMIPCYNEEENVRPIYEAVRNQLLALPYDYEILFIDNKSQDRTREIIREIAEEGNDCIIVGRDADVVLHAWNPFRVYVCADMESRIERCVRYEERKPEPERLTEIFLQLQDQKAENISLITAEHYVPLIIPALKRAKDQGLKIPVVYNTGTYERVEAIQALEGLVDIYLPDFKYISPRLSLAYSHTPDYFQYASKALAEMVRQCPVPTFADGSHSLDEPDDKDDPVMVKGVLVRHLALPGCGEDSRDILDYLHSTYGDSIFISIMNQYTPMPQVSGHPELGSKLPPEDYDALVDYAISIGITNGFIQDGDTASRSYIPAFDGTGL